MKCPKCNAENPDGSLLCNNCGHKLEQFESLGESLNDDSLRIEAPIPKHIDIKSLNNEVHEFNDNPRKKRTFFNNIDNKQIPDAVLTNQTGSFNLKDLEQKQDVVHEKKVVEKEEEEPLVDKRTGFIILIVLGIFAIILSIIVLLKFDNLTTLNIAARNLTNYFGSFKTNKIIIIIVYILLIALLSYDSYHSKQSTISKEATKNVIVSFILTIILTIIFDDISNLKDASLYISAIFKFIFIVLLLFANVYFRNSYNHIEQRYGLQNISFEFLIYFNIFTLLVLMFS